MPVFKIIALSSWAGLLVCQLGLLLPGRDVSFYWSLPLIAALLLPSRGLFTDRLYTYRWIGFMALVYLCIGISELAASPGLRLYAFGTAISSILLFLSAIYHARQLATPGPR